MRKKEKRLIEYGTAKDSYITAPVRGMVRVVAAGEQLAEVPVSEVETWLRNNGRIHAVAMLLHEWRESK
jgi:hypothetical protein